MDNATFVPSLPYLIPTKSFPVRSGSRATLRSFQSVSLIADFWLYLSHKPSRWMLKSISSVPTSSSTDRSVNIVPSEGLVKYQSSLSLISDCSETDHSAQPVFFVPPSRAALRRSVKTVPDEIGVGGVPQNIVCGLLESVTTYLSADSWPLVYS